MNFRDSGRQSYTLGSCASCILDVAFKYLKLGLAQNPHPLVDSEVKGIKILLEELASTFCAESSPNEIAQILFRKAAELSGLPDPWKNIRNQSNHIALQLLPMVRKAVHSIINPKDRLMAAIEWSVAGNTLDFGTAGHDVDISETHLQEIYNNLHEEGFAINHFNLLWDDMQHFGSILYICDNAGEIVFDRVVLEVLRAIEIDVTAVVKGGPISNDAIIEDAINAGIPDICPVITTGSPDLGFFPPGNSPEFLKRLKSASVVIAKGQANWEAIYAYQDQLPDTIHFYSIARLKCKVHADLFGLPKGANILYAVSKQDFRV
jgi:uncharacterized protein with ATP-grasp and redox domains